MRMALCAAGALLCLALVAMAGLGIVFAHAAADTALKPLLWGIVLLGGFMLLFFIRKGGD